MIAPSESVVTRVWDWPVRLVHWLLALLVMFSWLSAENGWLIWHRRSGYAILSLIIFRLYWGFFGSPTARFAQFLRGPKAVARYLRTAWGRHVQSESFGHNPLGGWNVIALLCLLLLQIALGCFAVDVDGLESGPLARHVSFETGRELASLHATLFNILLLLIGLHVAAVLVHLLYKRENLITPMLTGSKRIAAARSQTLQSASPWRAVIGLLGSILLIMALVLVVTSCSS